jgi:hypothetical protein
MTAVEKPTGKCPVCGRTFQLTKDGLLRKHWKRDENGKALFPLSVSCDGSGQDPA